MPNDMGSSKSNNTTFFTMRVNILTSHSGRKHL